MHCPNCRHDNPSTTRFCNACGAVLVEDAPGIGRRRVLRPWGLRSSAPPTISPDMDGSHVANRPRFDASIRIDLVLAGIVVVTIIGVAMLLPRSMASDALLLVSAPAAAPAGPLTTVVVPPLQTTSLSSPALVEPEIAPPPQPKERRRPKDAGRTQAPVAALPVVAAQVEMPAVEPAPPPPAAPVVATTPRDRWDGLRDALSACKAQSNIFERAVCEQGARIAHCTQHWDLHELCPSGRPAITQ